MDEDFEDKSHEELIRWLDNQNAGEDLIEVIKGSGVDARTFLDLNNEDLQDLTDSFLVRKKIRKILAELNDKDLENVTPVKKRKESPSSPTQNKDSDFLYVPCVPHSVVLTDPSSYSTSKIEGERKLVIRKAMDDLIGRSGGRPTEMELLTLAKTMASQYAILRDKPSDGLRENYKALTGFLRRRMYNVTPAQTKKGRKKGYSKAAEEKEDAGCIEIIVENKAGSSSQKIQKVPSAPGKTMSSDQVESVENPSEEALEKSLDKCTATTDSSKVKHLLKLTSWKKCVENLEKTPVRERVQKCMEEYPYLTKPEILIYNMTLMLPQDVEVGCLESELQQFLETVNQMAIDQGLVKSILPKSADERMLVALYQLPALLTTGKLPAVKGKKLTNGNFLIHKVKTDETWQEVAERHKNTGPWLMHHTVGSSTALVLMEKNNVVMKCKNAVEGILALMGIYYATSMPYPAQISGVLLLLQTEVLKDEVHEEDSGTLQKVKKMFNQFLADISKHDLDSFFN